MNIFKIIYSYFYYLFVKISYRLDLERKNNHKELVYYKDNKYVFMVKDVEVGKRLYEVFKNLDISYLPYKFFKYGITRKNTIKWFWVKGVVFQGWDSIPKSYRLIKIQHFVDQMQAKGFVLDSTKFECSECNSLARFLSFFIKCDEKDKIEKSKGCMIEYIHYVYSNGKSLKEFYGDFSNKVICEGYNIPYNSAIAKMCYDYFKTGTTPDDILSVLYLKQSEYENYSLIAIQDELGSKFNVTEKTDEYIVYDGCLKIYPNMSSEYENFLASEGIITKSHSASLEQIEAIIVDINNRIIGYKFTKTDAQKYVDVFENPTSQIEIFGYINCMVEYLEKHNKPRVYSETESNDFEIEKSLGCRRSSRRKFFFKSNTIKDLFNLTNNNWEMLKEQVTAIFFKLLADFMAKKYGKLTSKELFLEKNEIRFLSPIVAREFVNFALGKTVKYQVATVELFKLLYNRNYSDDVKFSYDSRFCYNPLKVNYTFDYEVEQKYNAKLEKGTIERLPDGRTVVIFKQSCNISVFSQQEKSALEKINGLLGNIADKNVKFVGFSEIILGTKRLNSTNMYNVMGYVTEPLKGEQLTDEVLLQLNNRDLLKVAGYLFSKFSKDYIYWKHVWMDKDFKFYINFMAEDFQIYRSTCNSNSAFVQMVFDSLVQKGYNSNAFIGWKVPFGGYRVCKQYLLNLADGFDVYCQEHNIYYNSQSGLCPVCAQTKYLVPQNFAETFDIVFEDSVATHYSIDGMYNLKIYKSNYAKQVKDTVMRLVSLRLYDNKQMYFFQDCFLPCKIAIDGNNQFVGCVYGSAKFEAIGQNTSDVCVDLEDLKALRNLPRLKSLIRLIYQVKEITNQKIGFVINPFSHVFLNTSHKKQVQILNIEFMNACNQNDLMKTKHWTCDYIYKVLESDSTIEFKRAAIPEGLDALLEKLTELAGRMTKKCTIHNMYYDSKYICCPKCISPSEQPKNIVYVDKTKYDSQTPINEGGEAFIYPYSEGIVAKVFKQGEVNNTFKCNVLTRILAKKDLLEQVNQENHKYKYVYPKLILVDNATKELFSYTMKWIENAFPISTLKDKAEIQKLGFSKKDIFEIIITVGEGIETLHKFGIYIGDLNGRNILFDEQKNVYFLDFDGMGVDGIAPEFCTDGYIDPRSKKTQNITMKDDWYSFAVQAFYYLTYTHPFNGIYYAVRNGRRITLDIPDKMEARISLLGNHGMKAPDIAESWGWMNAELYSAFLNIFEGDYRESIVPHLKKQYQALFPMWENISLSQIYRINPKFIATEKITGYGKLLQTADGKNIKNVFLSDDGKIAFIVYDKAKVVHVMDLAKKEVIFGDSISDATNVVVNDRTMYFNGISKENHVIFKRTIQTDGEILKETIGFGNQPIKYFSVKFNTKFILITQATQSGHELYCNSQRFCTFEYNSVDRATNANYNIIYDDATKAWLVVNNYGDAIVIQMSGKSTELDISKYINDVNLENIYFERGNIYIPGQECLYIVNVNGKPAKKMECHKIMTPESKIHDVNSDGFSVITQNVLYEVRKG